MTSDIDEKKKAEIIETRITEAGLFTRQFGSFSKSDYEILMFSIYLDLLEKPVRDYDISIDLGITESKVRNLRIKSQLLYPREMDWKTSLAAATSHGYYDSNNHTITITIEDPSLQNCVKNEIEKAYGMVLPTLNPKHLTLNIESYLILACGIDGNREDALNRLNKEFEKEQICVGKISTKKLTERIVSKASSVNDIISLVSTATKVIPSAVCILKPVLELISM